MIKNLTCSPEVVMNLGIAQKSGPPVIALPIVSIKEARKARKMDKLFDKVRSSYKK